MENQILAGSFPLAATPTLDRSMLYWWSSGPSLIALMCTDKHTAPTLADGMYQNLRMHKLRTAKRQAGKLLPTLCTTIVDEKGTRQNLIDQLRNEERD